ncbi:MAG: WD40/YVTN/BNR-like repeat-containing protein [Rubrobacter sp.]
MIRLYAAGGAVAVVENGTIELALEGRGAQCLAVDPRDPDVVYAGTSAEGMYRSRDGGSSWEELSGIEHPRVTAVAVSPADGAVYAGTEPSSLFVSRDGGASWRELDGLKNLPSAPTWSFPPRPWTSHVRAIAPGHSDADLVVAGIELGGVVRSSDGGETWQDQRPGAYPDCHSLSGHPSTPDAFYEAAGGGFAESDDGGESWASEDEGIERRYVWGLAVDREDPGLLYVSAASGPGAAHGPGFSDAAIYRRRGPGEQWEPVLEEMAEFPYALVAHPEISGALYAGLGDGTILRSPDAGESWGEVARVPKSLSALTAVVV